MHDIDRTLAEFGTSDYESEPFELADASQGEAFGEEEETDLAAELLSLSSEGELDQFLGDLIKKAGRAAGQFVRSPVGKALGGMLKGVAKKALPMVGGALGSVVPGVGTAIGTALGSAASNLFEMEPEALGPEEMEFEVARRVVRLGTEAARNAVLAPAAAVPQVAARNALAAAARLHAPGLARSLGGGYATGSPGQSGRWIRRGGKIVLYGV